MALIINPSFSLDTRPALVQGGCNRNAHNAFMISLFEIFQSVLSMVDFDKMACNLLLFVVAATSAAVPVFHGDARDKVKVTIVILSSYHYVDFHPVDCRLSIC